MAGEGILGLAGVLLQEMGMWQKKRAGQLPALFFGNAT
jgi:hypothetical protein